MNPLVQPKHKGIVPVLGVFLYTCPRCQELTAKAKCPDCGSKVLP